MATSFEPPGALDGGPDGLDLIRRLLPSLPGALDIAGAALLEIAELLKVDGTPDVQALEKHVAMDSYLTFWAVESLLALRTADDLTDPRRKDVHGGDSTRSIRTFSTPWRQRASTTLCSMTSVAGQPE